MNHISTFYLRHKNRVTLWLFICALALSSVASFAQEDPIEIEIPFDNIVTYLNQWLGVFGPIVLLIGMIPVAMALLRYITKLFQSAFGGSGR